MSVKTSRIAGLPDFRLQRADEMTANSARDSGSKGTLVRPELVRFPFQKAFTPYNPAMITHALMQRWRKDPSDLLMTDEKFHILALRRARAEEQLERIDVRREFEDDTAFLHAKAWVANETARSQMFFKQVRDLLLTRLADHKKERFLELAYLKFIREATVERGDEWGRLARKKLAEALQTRLAWKNWRTENLFGVGPNGAVFRMPHSGQPMETVNGEVHAQMSTKATKKHQQWRRDQNFVTTPNGAMQRTHNGGGDPVELVQARLQMPLVAKRHDGFRDWHDLNYLVATPNHSLVHAKLQGHEPAAATALLALPLIEDRIEKHWDYHLGGLLVTLPNGGMTPLARHGAAPEKVHADRYWPLRGENTAETEVWHEGHKFTVTSNGSFAPTPEVGRSIEKTASDSVVPLKEDITKGHDLWHEGHKFGPTPNGGFAPLKFVGQSLEKTGSDHAQPLIDRRTDSADLWHEGHKYSPTPNGGYAPLLYVGQSMEKAGSDAAQPLNDARSRNFYERYLRNRYVESSNHVIVPLKTTGQRFEVIAGNKAQEDFDVVTERFMSRYMKNNLHARDSREREHGDLSKINREKEMKERATINGGSMPLPFVKEYSTEAPKDLASKRSQTRSIKEIQRNLAAHEITVSRLQDHAVVDMAKVVPPPRKGKI